MAIVRRGINLVLEAEADRLIRESLAGVHSHQAKKDILTTWKYADRKKREIYSTSGVADPSLRQGMFHRVANADQPHLNSRDGIMSVPRRITQDHHNDDT